MLKLSSLANRVILFASLLILVGCSGKSRDMPELGTVSGTVTMDGAPLEKVSVNFIPESGRPASGVTDKNGYYVVAYLPKVMGAKVGKNSVTIAPFINDDTDMNERRAKSKLKIPKKYNANTTLSAEVKKGKNVFDFKLTSN